MSLLVGLIKSHRSTRRASVPGGLRRIPIVRAASVMSASSSASATPMSAGPDHWYFTCDCARKSTEGVLLGPEAGSECPHHHALAPPLSTAIRVPGDPRLKRESYGWQASLRS
jgi:hypothetical protein